ncbi:MAG: zf-HC2 domain-containing protein [Planctomyces sp.]|nr:zf-HC2 domain-containing protein [Planctomyces sp.]
MICDEVAARLSEFYDGELAADQAADIKEHISTCEVCSAALRSFDQIGELCKNLGTFPVFSKNWDMIVDRLDKRNSRFRRWRFPGSIYQLLSLVSMLLIAPAAISYIAARPATHEQIHRVAGDHIYRTLIRYAHKPRAVVDELAVEYKGTLVSLDAAEDLLGYVPVVSKLPSAGYRVASTHVLKMPCCTCPASLCVREDGSEFLIFEHNERQPLWFGDSPMISARCCGQVCQCAELPDQLAVTWKVGARYVTAIGVDGLDEIAGLMTVVNHSNSAG